MALVYTTRRALLCSGLLLTLFPLSMQAQTAGAVTGTLLDKATQQPLPFASVVLLRLPDSTVATGAQTAENGGFRLEPVAPGNYALRASVLGYGVLRRGVTLAAGQKEQALGSVALLPTATQLKGVTVTGERAAMEDNLDKKVINVEKDLASVGGSAVNVLQNVPSVTVDQSGAVSMRGSSNITILVDGKATGAASGGMGTRLDQIPASSIEKVEIVTNPSARYDAAGSGGVINIILKKQKKDGWNGTAAVNAGTRDKYTSTLSLNRRAGKLNLFASYDMRDNRFRRMNTTQQEAQLNGVRLTTDQNSRGFSHNFDQNARLGFDYTISPEQSLSLSVQPNWHRGNNTGRQSALLQSDTSAVTQFQRTGTYVTEKVDVVDVSTDYRRTWAKQKGRELTGSLHHTRVGADVLVGQQMLEGVTGLPDWQQDFDVTIRAYVAQADYVHPLANKGRVDVGLKSQWQANDGSADFERQNLGNEGRFDRVAERSYAYEFNEYVQAGYATYQNEMGKWSYQGGIRAEYTHTYGQVAGNQGKFDLQYFNLFPSATVARKLAGDQRLQLSYSRRLNRPGFMQLLPFQLYQDQRSYRIGDPSLRPEYINALEAGHQVTIGGATLSSTLFWRQTNNAIQQFRDVDTVATRLNPSVGITSRMYNLNFGQATSMGAEMSLNQAITKWWRVTASGSLFRLSITAATENENSKANLTGTVRVMNTFNPTPKLDVQLTGNYRAATLTPQGRILPVYGIDLALRQRLFSDRAALTLRVSDIFDTRRERLSAFAPGYTASGEFKNETQVGYLGFSWYFGSNKPSKKIEAQPQGGGGGFGS
ncbi:TonB-dependent receptor domain-containing protein [Hymenobacter koreensis]|uniref:Outer membrane beta-barrel family protein n=1 Tax=Hymenobacter koreensis TaxID=1084523 RepID=A0ABP8JBA5_9BACT